MKTLVKTAGMSREEWLKWRTYGIGGSDVSVIAGVNKFRSVFQLWLEKTGQVEPQESDSQQTHFGTVLEPIIKKEFTRVTGKKIRSKRFLIQSEIYPYMIANLDGVIYEDGEMVLFEAKTASAYKKDIWEQGVPLEYVYQVQHYMAVTGTKKTYVAALVGGNAFYYHAVYRDEAMIAQIISMEKEFWEEYVLPKREPIADGSKSTTEYLNGKYRESNGGEVELPKEVAELCNYYGEVSKQLKMLEEKKDAVANQLKNYLKGNEVGRVGNHTITWKQVFTTGFDKKRLAQENKEVYDKYCTKSSYRKLSVA